MEKYKNEEGLIGVLVSYGYGAGWSTWNDENKSFLAMDKTLVEMSLRNAPESEVVEYLTPKFDDMPYMGGWQQSEVEWLKEGTTFDIQGYDGAESLRTLDDLTMCA